MAEIPAQPTEYQGIDLSHHQSPSGLPWDEIAQTCDFVMARATYGTSVDREVERHLSRARSLGKVVGLYHFFRASQPWEPQLEAFRTVAATVALGPGDLIPALDIERDPVPAPGLGPSKEWSPTLRRFAEALARNFGGCLLYLTRADWAALGRPDWVRDHFLWAVHWRKQGEPRRPALEPAVPDGMHWTLHQYGVGRYDVAGGLQDARSPGVLDHDRARMLPTIPRPGEPPLTPTLRPLDLPRVRAAVADAMTLDWEEFRAARSRVIEGD